MSKFKPFVFVLIAVLAVAIAVPVVATTLTSKSKSSVDLDNVEVEVDSETVKATDTSLPLGGKKVVMSSTLYGYAFSDDEIASLIKQSEEMGYTDTSFYEIAANGDEVEDPLTGIKFLVRKDGIVNLQNPSKVVIPNSSNLEELQNFDDSKMSLKETIETEYGLLEIYG